MSVMSHMTRDELLQVQASARIYQERADTALEPWGIRAPSPVLGQDPGKYRRRLAIMLKNQLPEGHRLRKLQYKRMDDAVLNNFEPELYKAVADIAFDPMSTAPGEMRRMVKKDQAGRDLVHWIGQRSFIHEFTRPGRLLESMQTPTGLWTRREVKDKDGEPHLEYGYCAAR
jgi:hypothetical protein